MKAVTRFLLFAMPICIVLGCASTNSVNSSARDTENSSQNKKSGGPLKSLFQDGLITKKSAAAPTQVSSGLLISSDYVKEPKNQLIWRRCDIGTKFSPDKKCYGQPLKLTWIEAVEYVQTLNEQNFEGSSNWRLPDSTDLKAIFDAQPGIAPTKPNEISKDFYGYLTVPENKCALASRLLFVLFGERNSTAGTFVENQRWLADSDPFNGQNPLSISYGTSGFQGFGRCDAYLFAYGRQYGVKMDGPLRGHARQPFTVVRGGPDSFAWKLAIKHISNKDAINSESRAQGRAHMAAVDGLLTAEVGLVKKIFESGPRNWISVEATCVTGMPCFVSNLTIEGGSGKFEPSHKNSGSGSIHPPSNDRRVSGRFSYSYTIKRGNEQCVANGYFTVNEPAENIKINHYPNCSLSNVHQF